MENDWNKGKTYINMPYQKIIKLITKNFVKIKGSAFFFFFNKLNAKKYQ